MHDHLYKYLSLSGKLTIPLLGNIILVTEPASVDPTGVQIFPPKFVFHFEGKNEVADKFFLQFLSEEMGIAEAEATKQYAQFVSRLLQEIKEKNATSVKWIGHFSKGAGGEIGFVSETNLAPIFPTMQLSLKIAEQVEELRANKNDWWVFAIILFLLGGAALTYFYIG